MKTYELLCPVCGQKAQRCNFYRITPYSLAGLSLPYFLCSPCRKIYFDRRLIYSIISNWRRDTKWGAGKIPFLVLYKKYLNELEEMIKDYHLKRLGYQFAKFKKK